MVTFKVSFKETKEIEDRPIVISRMLFTIKEVISFKEKIFVINELKIRNKVATPATMNRVSMLFFIEVDKIVPKL